jgi:type VI secretion system secreted protein Hcp
MKKSTLRICGAAMALAVAMIAMPRLSPAPAYMKLGDIKGEATDTDHKDWILIESWSWGESNPGYVGVPTSEKANFQDLSVTKRVDKATPKLMLACASGQQITSGTLVFTTRAPGTDNEPYLKYELKDVLISSFQHGGGAADGSLPTESVSLNFSKIEMTYFAVDAAGGDPMPITEGWDIKNNTPTRPPGRTGVIVE